MERKEFVKKFAIGGSVLLAVPTFLSSCAVGDEEIFIHELTIDLTSSEFSELAIVGGFAYKDDIIIIRTGTNQYTALTKICTHQGCTVSYDAANNQLPCPCHDSLFNISGGVINGPALQSLKKYDVRVDGDLLIITL
ncbi:MAG: Rieske (2Fe-2S) protein [Bacteroidales bacterium]|nr:Rieske (2Fe-2S) protein [Bacteroidales bacterium]